MSEQTFLSTLGAPAPLTAAVLAIHDRGQFGATRATPRENWALCTQPGLTSDPRAYRRLLEDVSRLAKRIAARIVLRLNFPNSIVDDVAQETMLAVHQKLASWDHGRPLEGFVVAVARNKTIDAIRRARLHRFRPFDELDEAFGFSFAPAPEALVDIARLIARLSPRGREIVTAIVLREETVADVAARLAMTAGAVRVAMHRAIRAMKPEEGATRQTLLAN